MTTSEKIMTAMNRRDAEMRKSVSDYVSEHMKSVKTRRAFFTALGGKTDKEGKLLIKR